jgi:hypothetical protein
MAGIELWKFTHGLRLYIPNLKSKNIKDQPMCKFAQLYACIHNKYVFHVIIHIFVLKYLVQIHIIQNQFKISEGGKWNSHQMPCGEL